MSITKENRDLVDEKMYYHAMLCNLCKGMDLLSLDEKQQCLSFSNAMNAIEGIPVSKETGAEIDAWKEGKQSFLVVFENTLKKYGFPVEKRK